MTEKLKLDLPLILPDVADERDACVGRLTRLLQAEGLGTAHVVHENGSARLCLHYDPQRFSVNRVSTSSTTPLVKFTLNWSRPVLPFRRTGLPGA